MKRIATMFILICAMTAAAWAAPVIPDSLRPKPFQDGDVVACVGDSIFHGGKFTEYLQAFYAARFPERNVRIINCGIGGHTAASTLRRLDWDILPYKANVAVVMLGMNDVGITAYGEDKTSDADRKKQEGRFLSYQKNMTELISRLQASGARVILATPTPYDQVVDVKRQNYFGANDMLGRFADWVVAFAPEHNCKVVDFHYPMNAVNAEGQKTNPKFTIIGTDRVHPRDPGHSMMACLFLKAQGLLPDDTPCNGGEFLHDVVLKGKTDSPEAKKFAALADRWRAAMKRIRAIAYGRAYLETRKVDVEDPKALAEAVAKLEADKKIPAHRTRNARTFADDRDKRPQYEKQAVEIAREMREIAAKMK